MHGKEGVKTEHYGFPGHHPAAVAAAAGLYADKLSDEEHLYGGLGEWLSIFYSLLATGLHAGNSNNNN